MPQILRCSTSINLEAEWTKKRAVNCGWIALSCADCGESGGCIQHALFCHYCGRAVCYSCAFDHVCQAQRQKAIAA